MPILHIPEQMIFLFDIIIIIKATAMYKLQFEFNCAEDYAIRKGKIRIRLTYKIM